MSKVDEAQEEAARQAWELSMLREGDIPEFAVLGCVFLNPDTNDRQFNYRVFAGIGSIELDDVIELLQGMVETMAESAREL